MPGSKHLDGGGAAVTPNNQFGMLARAAELLDERSHDLVLSNAFAFCCKAASAVPAHE